jgi:hypothetical protein
MAWRPDHPDVRPLGLLLGGQLFGRYPIRTKDHDLRVRLSPGEQSRALASGGVRAHRRFGTRGWIECDVTDPAELPRALQWLRRGYEHASRQAGGPDLARGP